MDYAVVLEKDRLDGVYGDGEYAEVTTQGTIVLDGEICEWRLGGFNRNRSFPFNDGAGVEIFISGSTDWVNRADAVYIYWALVEALQKGHHPEHCSCCYDQRHERMVAKIFPSIKKRLEAAGYTVNTPEEFKEASAVEGNAEWLN